VTGSDRTAPAPLQTVSITPMHGRQARARLAAVAVSALGMLVLCSCGGGPTGRTPSPSSTRTTSTAGAVPTGLPRATPGATNSGSPFDTDSPAPTSAGPACTGGVPVRVDRAESDARRTTEIVTMVSDGKNLTYGTREQSNFEDSVLKAPDGTMLTDDATLQKVASLLAVTKNRVLLVRPEAPDAKASTDRKPFSSPGTYVLYNASTVLTAQVVIQCGAQEQNWVFTGEANPTTGVINCAVEPPKSSTLARVVYGNNC
jgi:hypothetical protein